MDDKKSFRRWNMSARLGGVYEEPEVELSVSSASVSVGLSVLNNESLDPGVSSVASELEAGPSLPAVDPSVLDESAEASGASGASGAAGASGAGDAVSFDDPGPSVSPGPGAGAAVESTVGVDWGAKSSPVP